MKSILSEDFRRNALDKQLQWLNPPRRWRLSPESGVMAVEPDPGTDFWQRTHYGFQNDNGHFCGMSVEGDFAISTRVAVAPVHQYDQAGLMIRLDAACWIKTSVEHETESPPQLGVVVTGHGFSDWSMQDFPLPGREVSLRLSKRGADLTAEFKAPDDERWKLLRVAHWSAPPGEVVTAGLYACSPKGSGFRAEFGSLQIVRLD